MKVVEANSILNNHIKATFSIYAKKDGHPKCCITALAKIEEKPVD